MQGLNKTLTNQIGLRWIIEAICTGIEKVVLPDYKSEISSVKFFHDAMMSQAISQTEQENQEAQIRKLNGEKPMLVGHNLFIDLIYLLACFFGPLPERVEDFQAAIAILFPLSVDTKYMADVENSPHYDSSLEGIDAEFSQGPTPTIGRLFSGTVQLMLKRRRDTFRLSRICH